VNTRKIANELLSISKELSAGPPISGKIFRTADLGWKNGYLKWEIRPKHGDDESNYNMIGDIAWKELKYLERKKLVEFYQGHFEVYIQGQDLFGASIELMAFESDRLPRELKKMGFRVRW